MCVGSRAVAGGSLQEWLSVRHLGLDHDQTGRTPQLILRVILQIEKCLTGAEAEEKRGAAESLAPTDPSSVDE